MKNIKLFENFSEEPIFITVKFYGDDFMKHYWEGSQGIKIYQSHGFASNLKNLEVDGHTHYGDGGLEIRKGYYYPLFKVVDKENIKNSFWYYIVYGGDEINIVQSSEHSDQGIDIPNNFNSLKTITHYWYCKFNNGIIPGEKDHRGYFEIVSVKN